MRFIKLIKIFNSFLILVTSLFFITCSNSTTLQTEKTIDKPTSPPILEISEDAEGAWNITGKTLFFRLYENGVVEFEYPDDTKVKSGQNKAEEINILKRIKISEEDKQKFIKLLNTENFQGLQESYQRKCCCTDATTRYEINFQSSNKQRSVNLIGYCGFNELIKPRSFGDLIKPEGNYQPNFPVEISNLITLVYDNRVKFQPSNKPQ